jgi:hypothetical protein
MSRAREREQGPRPQERLQGMNATMAATFEGLPSSWI